MKSLLTYASKNWLKTIYQVAVYKNGCIYSSRLLGTIVTEDPSQVLKQREGLIVASPPLTLVLKIMYGRENER